MTYQPSSAATVVASVSGGKDSTAMLLHLRDVGIWPVRAVFFDTGWEHADTYQHIDYLAHKLGITVERRAGAACDDDGCERCGDSRGEKA